MLWITVMNWGYRVRIEDYGYGFGFKVYGSGLKDGKMYAEKHAEQ
jgi:hypothetical protein